MIIALVSPMQRVFLVSHMQELKGDCPSCCLNSYVLNYNMKCFLSMKYKSENANHLPRLIISNVSNM